MFYTIYKITNQLDGKYYIGKHQTKKLDDGYFGSGKLLKRAIKKHGIKNFTKEILHVFDTEEEMNAKEKELVILEESSYNLCPGGKGGFGYINNNQIGIPIQKQIVDEEKRNKLISVGLKTAWSKGKFKNVKFFTQGFKGKTHSEETKQKMSQSSKGKVPWNKGKAWKDWHPSAK